MSTCETLAQDVLLVCRNGHVITDLLRSFPELAAMHCDRCGATTLDRCPTCGQELPGGFPGLGLVPVGRARPPQFCSACGAAFPWAKRPAQPGHSAGVLLEQFLRRLPRTIRALRTRHADRLPFRVGDDRDLEDLVRALLPLHFDDVRPELRTPRYAPGARTDFVLAAEHVALTLKVGWPGMTEAVVGMQLQEDIVYYEGRGGVDELTWLLYDPERSLLGPRDLEATWCALGQRLRVRGVIA